MRAGCTPQIFCFFYKRKQVDKRIKNKDKSQQNINNYLAFLLTFILQKFVVNTTRSGSKVTQVTQLLFPGSYIHHGDDSCSHRNSVLCYVRFDIKDMCHRAKEKQVNPIENTSKFIIA